MQTVSATNLKIEVNKILRWQGYKLKQDGFILRHDDRDTKRDAHRFAKAERISKKEDFIISKSSLARQYLVDGKNIEIEKIKPKLIEVKAGTEWEDLFRWWNLVWWSLPYEHAYGRQMRFIIWDQYHNAPIGLIGLQSPILSWSVRDKHLEIPIDNRDYWVNQSLSAQRLGALPPYNYILGGKLVASLMTADVVRKKFQTKYEYKKTILMGRNLPARLLFITTTGAYGKSSVYSRLKFRSEHVAEFIGYTQGSGSFHIPNALYGDLIRYLEKKGYDTRRGCGNGPSRKLRLIDQSLGLLGFENGARHGIQRAVYLFPLVKNLKEVIQKNARPKWIHRNINDVTSFWIERWANPRAERDKSYLEFSAEKFIKQAMRDLKKYKKTCQII